MTNKQIFFMLLILAFVGCQKDEAKIAPVISTPTRSAVPPSKTASRLNYPNNNGGSEFISISEANTMISSYLYSINYLQNDTDVRSFSINADKLRAYLSDTTLTNVKLFIAHTSEFAQDGNSGTFAGYQSGGLTIIVAGYDNEGNYVYHEGKVLDRAAPCPYSCIAGAAGSNFLN